MYGVLRAAWYEPAPAGAPRRVWRDWLLVAVLLPATVLEGALQPGLELRWVQTVIVAGLVPTLLWRRTRPLLMIIVAFGVTGVFSLVTGQSFHVMTIVYVLLLVYAVFRWGSGRAMIIGAAVMIANIVGPTGLPRASVSDIIGGLAVVSVAVTSGLAVRFRSRARTRELDQVRLLERERLARDLHDTVAHHVSAMAIRAQAGLAGARTRPDAANEALMIIDAEASRTLDQMRALVRDLRDSDPVDHADLLQFAGQDRSGPPVEVRISGDLAGLPAPVGTTLFRLAQESITNARRHARQATKITLRVAVEDAVVRLDVCDDGERVDGPPTGTGSGYGLIGMRERAGLLGGTCDAGPNPERGWTVSAVLPLTAAV